MNSTIDVILPVFLVLGLGYAAAWSRILSEEAIDGLMRYAQNIGTPILLFKSISALDLARAYDAGLLLSFYIGALISFGVGLAGAILIFKRALPDAVAIGFACLFSNTLLLGVPITERAYGTEALAGNFAIISLHAPIFYGLGILCMEIAKSHGHGLAKRHIAGRIARAVAVQPLIFGITAGFVVNLTGITLPASVNSTATMLAATAIPTALFGLGAVLRRYRLDGDKATVAMICGCSLLLHPAVAYLLAHSVFKASVSDLRSSVITAAMAPGVNSYLFAHYYGVAKRVNAAAVIAATAASIFTIPIWLHLLP
ncbi:MAG TPA: AEC family transporter [Ensifer sp.]|nr:AEC family transporter [Ensifer sp.]